jgi:hypothetical protein
VSAAGFAGAVAKAVHNWRLLQDDDDDDGNNRDDDSSNNGDGEQQPGEDTVIRVKAGTYEENVEVPPYKTNIALVGEGRDTTVITGSRSAAGGWTTFRTATFGKSNQHPNHKSTTLI